MSDVVRRILVDAGLDPRLHGGVDGAVLLLVGRWREASNELERARAERNEFTRMASGALTRLIAAQDALVDTGYFTREQVCPDIAPRILELVSTAEARQEDLRQRFLTEQTRANLAEARLAAGGLGGLV